MPPGLMSRRKSRLMGWGMGIGESGIGIGNGESGMGNRNGESESASAGRGSSKPIIPIAPPESL